MLATNLKPPYTSLLQLKTSFSPKGYSSTLFCYDFSAFPYTPGGPGSKTLESTMYRKASFKVLMILQNYY